MPIRSNEKKTPTETPGELAGRRTVRNELPLGSPRWRTGRERRQRERSRYGAEAERAGGRRSSINGRLAWPASNGRGRSPISRPTSAIRARVSSRRREDVPSYDGTTRRASRRAHVTSPLVTTFQRTRASVPFEQNVPSRAHRLFVRSTSVESLHGDTLNRGSTRFPRA